MKRLAFAWLLLSLLLAGCSVHIDGNRIHINGNFGCAYEADHAGNLAVNDARVLVVNARSGSLTIRGHEESDSVEVEGRACAPDARTLDQIALRTSRSGDTVRVEVLFPDRIIASTRMDLTISVPSDMVAQVEKSSGDVIIEELAGLDITKSSGDLDIQRIHGDLRVKSSSGDLYLAHVDGDATVEAGSGDLTLRNLKGHLTIPEKSSGTITLSAIGGDLHLGSIGSGDLEVSQVGGGVFLERKSSGRVVVRDVGQSVEVEAVGSGEMDVRQVQGDLIVRAKSSGRLDYSGIEGRVDVPRR